MVTILAAAKNLSLILFVLEDLFEIRRQYNRECRTFSWFAFYFYLTPVVLDDLIAD